MQRSSDYPVAFLLNFPFAEFVFRWYSTTHVLIMGIIVAVILPIFQSSAIVTGVAASLYACGPKFTTISPYGASSDRMRDATA